MIINLNRSFLSVSHARLSNLKTNTQQGVVLFFALIALVVMSLAAVALIRSVDTNSLIAGNLSFKQSSMLSADTGVETAITWVTNNAGLLEADSMANGYYATSDVPAHPDAKALVDENGVAGIIVNPDSQGNTITYVIQRMCRDEVPTRLPFDDADKKELCLFGPLTEPADNKGVNKEVYPTGKAASLIYRVTAKVEGPKNTVSYIQTFVY